MIASCLQTIALTVLTLASVLNAPSCKVAQQPAPAQAQNSKKKVDAMSPQEARHVEEAADRFVRRFRETLDFGVVFDETFVSDAVQRLRKANYFQNLYLSPQLVEKVNNSTLERAYKAFMNFYYLKATYDLSIRPLAGNEQSGDPPLPPEITSALKASKHLSVLLDEGSGDAPTVTTRQELEQYVADLNNIAALYRQRLPPNVFTSPTYKANLKAINKDKRSSVRIRNGYEGFGIRGGVKVYEVEQDIFIFFFVKEGGELKVLTLGMGN
jgi:hypothetical protein